jgi:hypothetical protein
VALGWLAIDARERLFSNPMTHVPRYVPARTNDGWSVAALVVLLAAACIVATTIIHKRTYKHPTDPTYKAAGERGVAGAPSH